MKHLVPFVFAATLVVGCGATAPVATPTRSATMTTGSVTPVATTAATSSPLPATPTSVRTTTPSSTPISLLAWDVPPKSGIVHVDAIIAAVLASDATKIEPYVTGVMITCGFNDAPECPAGVAPGTLVSAFGFGACPGGGSWARLAPPSTGMFTTATQQAGSIAGLQLRYLRVIYGVEPGTWQHDAGVRYSVVFQRQRDDSRGVYLEITDRGIAQVIGWRDAHCGVWNEVVLAPPP